MEVYVYNDCMNLAQEFAKTASYDFDAFAQLWNELGFEHLWSAQTNYVEVLQTTAAALHVGKRLMCARRPSGQPLFIDDANVVHKYRIAGVFLLYSIYFKQPTTDFVKIIVSLHTWQTMREFIETTTLDSALHQKANRNINQQNQQQARYIFYKLVQARAFSCAALDYPVGLEGLVAYDKSEENYERSNKMGKLPIQNRLRTELVSVKQTSEILQTLQTLETSYNQMKTDLSKRVGGVNASALPATTILQELNETLSKIDQIIDPSSSTTSSKTNSDTAHSTGNKRRHLKEKAFGRKQQPDLEDLELEIERQLDCEQKDEAGDVAEEEENNVGPQRRMSVKTIFTKQLPYAVSKDLELPMESQSSEDEDTVIGTD